MTLLNTYISGTQTLGKINTYITLFIVSIFILIALFFLYNAVFNYTEKPPCSADSQGQDCENVPRRVSIAIIIIILAVLVAIFYFNFALKDNKAYQTMSGVKTQANFVNNLFRRPRFRGPQINFSLRRGARGRR